ncbi:MAG: hypothetical protein IKE43_09850 [Coriobacteriales bacterium]|nr:hypothetical protein [Coriobacteriales bacterium]
MTHAYSARNVCALMLVLLCMGLALLTACDPGESESSKDQQTSQGAGLSATQNTAQNTTVYPFTTANLNLLPEKWIVFDRGFALSLLVEESEVPVTVTPFGTISGFDIEIGWKSGASSIASAMTFEPLTGTDSYAARATFYYDSSSPIENPEEFVSSAENLYYRASDESGSHTYRLSSLARNLPITLAEDSGTWPDVSFENQLGLPEGTHTVPLNETLQLYTGYLSLHKGLDNWVIDLFNDCHQKLVYEGSLEQPGEGAPNKYFIFDNDFNIVFADAETGGWLMGGPYEPLDNVVYYYGDRTLAGGKGVMLNPYTAGEGAQYPLYYPVSYLIRGLSYDSFDIPQQDFAYKFADSLEGCSYVLAYMGMTSRVDKEFYMGGADRRVATTVVFVMDAQTREFVHIHSVGTDVPAGTTTSPSGDVLYNEAHAYMDDLLGW